MDETTQETIKLTVKLWRQVKKGEDPNTIDVYDCAGRGLKALNLQIPTELPEKEIGVEVVELVNEKFVKGSLIRKCTPQELAERGYQLVNHIQAQKLLSFGPSESYVVALYIWHGCICMAKNLRKNYVVGGGREAPYTIEQRQQGYNSIQKCWQEEENRGNPWVRYGVSLARLFEKGEKVDDWIPKDSPYWDC